MSLEVSLTKRLGRSFTLDVAFRVDGSCLGILGASGCGKSMTLKCIAGIERPDRGRIVLNGRVLFDSEEGINLRPQERRVGYLFQDYALFPNMTVARNIVAGMAGNGAGRAAVVEGLLRDFQLEGLGKRYPHQLSGGQRQRAALARMLAAGPEIILLDEPLSALDTHLREYMQLRLLDIVEKFGDAVMVTHSRDEVYKICPGLLAMEHGGVLATGPTAAMFRDPGLVSVAKLTGCKNISRIEKLPGTRVRAVDWDMELDVGRPVPDGATHIGIRAHDILPWHGESGRAANVFPMRVVKRTEDPFEWIIHFVNAAGSEAPAPEREPLWWKTSKQLPLDGMPARIALPPAALMLLTS